MEIVESEGDLLEVVGALRPRRRLANPLHRRHEQGDQDGDDRDHHQEFDEGKAPAHRGKVLPHGRFSRCFLRMQTWGERGLMDFS